MAIYFIDPVNGDDNNNGTSMSTPWATLNHGGAIAGTADNPDIFFIRRGTTVTVGEALDYTANSNVRIISWPISSSDYGFNLRPDGEDAWDGDTDTSRAKIAINGGAINANVPDESTFGIYNIDIDITGGDYGIWRFCGTIDIQDSIITSSSNTFLSIKRNGLEKNSDIKININNLTFDSSNILVRDFDREDFDGTRVYLNIDNCVIGSNDKRSQHIFHFYSYSCNVDISIKRTTALLSNHVFYHNDDRSGGGSTDISRKNGQASSSFEITFASDVSGAIIKRLSVDVVGGAKKLKLFFATNSNIEKISAGISGSIISSDKVLTFTSDMIKLLQSSEEWVGLYQGYKSYEVEIDLPDITNPSKIIYDLEVINSVNITWKLYYDAIPDVVY